MTTDKIREVVDHALVCVVRGLPAEEYHSRPALGSTAIRTAADHSVAHYLADRERESLAMRRGTLHHVALLEPEQFDESYIVAPPVGQCEALTKGGKGPRCSKTALPGAEHCGIHGGDVEAAAFAASVEAAGKHLVTAEEKSQALEMAHGVRACLARSKYPKFLDIGEHEVSYAAYAVVHEDHYEVTTDPSVADEPNVLAVQARSDIKLPGLIADAKGCAKSSELEPRNWQWKIHNFGLHIQAALYVDIAEAVECCYHEFAWIAHEAQKPYGARIFTASSVDLSLGRVAVHRGLVRWLAYLRDGDAWYGWPDDKEEVSRPYTVLREEMGDDE